MKNVFTDISEIAHLWANQSQHSASNRGNFFFEGDTIYSYGHHFPIARHITNEDGKKFILFTQSSYSNTTSKHIQVVSQAVIGQDVVYVPSLRMNFEENIKAFTNRLEVYFDKLKRA